MRRSTPIPALFLLAVLAAACSAEAEQDSHARTPASIAQPSERLLLVDPGAGSGQVLVFDPQTGEVDPVLASTYNPAATLSSDGRIAYVGRRAGDRDLLFPFDTATWAAAGHPLDVTGRYYYKVYPWSQDSMKFSPDGRLLYYLAYGETKDGCGDCDGYLRVTDVETGEQVREIHLPWCSARTLELDRSRPFAYLTCSKGRTAALNLETGELVPLPVYGEAAYSLVDHENDRWYVLTRGLRLFRLNLAIPPHEYPPVPEVLLDTPREYGDTGPFEPVPRAGVHLSPDGRRLYVGIAGDLEPGDGGRAGEIWAFDTETLQRIDVLTLDVPAYHFALSPDGSRIYSINATERTVSVLAIATGEETVFENVGRSPARIIVLP